MNKNQANKLNMYKSVAAYLKENQTVVDSVPVMVTIQASFDEKIKNIVETDADRDGITAGKILDKKKEEAELEASLLKLKNGVSVYAMLENNTELIQLTDYTDTEIKEFRDAELIEKAYSIYNRAKEVEETLVNYGITTADIEAVLTNADEFAQSIGINGSANAESKQTTAKLKELFAEADDLLYGKLDKLAFVLMASNKDFYEGYKNARQIIDR